MCLSLRLRGKTAKMKRRAKNRNVKTERCRGVGARPPALSAGVFLSRATKKKFQIVKVRHDSN